MSDAGGECGAAEGTAVAGLPAYENYTGAAHLRAAVPCDLTAVDAYKDYKTGITSPPWPLRARFC